MAIRHAQAEHVEVAHIVKALAGPPVILLKDAAYTMAALPHAHGRLYSGADLFVSREAIGEVKNRMMIHGWLATHYDP